MSRSRTPSSPSRSTPPEPSRFAAESAEINDTFLVLNGDVLTDFDASALVAFHRSREADASIALTPVPDPSAFGVVPTDADGRVTAFIEKPPLAAKLRRT